MLIKFNVGKREEMFVIILMGLGDVSLTLEDKKRKVYIHPHFPAGKELETILKKYEEVFPWDITQEMRKEVLDALPEHVMNFLRFFFNLK